MGDAANPGYRADGKLTNYSAERTGYPIPNDVRNYIYDIRGQLTSETYRTRPGVDRTLNYGYADKLGLRTSAYGTGKAPKELESVTTQLTGFGRPRQREYNSLLRPRLADGTVSAESEVILTLDGFDLPGLDIGFTGAKWKTELLLGVGSHKLDARAVTPGATAEVNDRHFVAEFHRDQVGETLSYDNSGNVTKRAYVWKDWKPDPKDASERDWKYDASGSDQLTWDAAGRLLKMTLSGGGRNADWSAVYDGFGRRLRTVCQVAGDSEQRIEVAYDPEVTFQELWTKIDGKRFWHAHGPDLSGGFGGMEGSGGLEWIIDEESGEATGILNDLFGNAIATLRGNSETWNPTRFTGYGAYPGLQVEVVENGASLADSIGWRGERLDPTGLYWLGHRYYDPNAGHFLSADPLGHSASLSLYDYCGGDPINFADPDGLLVRNVFVAGGDMLAGVGRSLWLGAKADAGIVLDGVNNAFYGTAGLGLRAAASVENALTIGTFDPSVKGSVFGELADALANRTTNMAQRRGWYRETPNTALRVKLFHSPHLSSRGVSSQELRGQRFERQQRSLQMRGHWRGSRRPMEVSCSSFPQISWRMPALHGTGLERMHFGSPELRLV